MKMEQESSRGAFGSLEPTLSAQATGKEMQLRSECEKLREALMRLENEHAVIRDQLLKLQQECDGYRRVAYAWARQNLPEHVFIDEDQNWLPLEAFLPDLEHSLRRN
ncbi:MAG: hypothetical protein FJ271_14790 [Planctomycetes bacterium]|nr:hypothetical protein [Planctomycetota bacterium]